MYPPNSKYRTLGVFRVGTSQCLVTVEEIAHEFGVSPADICTDLLEFLQEQVGGPPTIRIGTHVCVNLHALEVAIHQYTDPETPVEEMENLSKRWDGATRAAIQSRLSQLGERLLRGSRRRAKHGNQKRTA